MKKVSDPFIENFPNINSKRRKIIELECNCGNIKKYRYYDYINSKIKSCGCERYKLKELFKVGDIFNRLTIVEDLGMIKSGNIRKYRYCKVKCECGETKDVQFNNIKNNNIKSCGCLSDETRSINVKNMQLGNIKHGDSTVESENNRLYSTWSRIKSRCYNKNNEKYKWYGGKNIKVCDEWLNYDNFKSWALSNGYSKELTIDRIDVLGNYEPSNCQWLTMQDNIKKEYTIDRLTRINNRYGGK